MSKTVPERYVSRETYTNRLNCNNMAINMTETKSRGNTRKTGDIGEKIAQKFLKERGFSIIETNYLKNWGELDIVAKNAGIIHFVEVKTYKYDSKRALYGSVNGDNWQPEELVDARKLHQIEKALETWLREKQWRGEYQIDVIAVKMVPDMQFATVKYIDNVIKG